MGKMQKAKDGNNRIQHYKLEKKVMLIINDQIKNKGKRIVR